MLVPMALEPMEMIMREASPLTGLRWVSFWELHPEPMNTLSRSPWPLSSVTARHRFPSAVRVNVMPVLPLPTKRPLSSSSSSTAPALRVLLGVDEPAVELAVRRADGTRGLAIDGPAAELPADGAPITGPATGPPVEETEGACGAAAVCGAGVALFDGWPVDDWVTAAAAGVDVGVVLLTSVLTALAAPVETGTVVVAAARDWITAIVGFDPPLPLGATVVLGACGVVTGAAVVGGVAGATVVTGALLTAVVP